MSFRVNEVNGENLQYPPPIKNPGYANDSTLPIHRATFMKLRWRLRFIYVRGFYQYMVFGRKKLSLKSALIWRFSGEKKNPCEKPHHKHRKHRKPHHIVFCVMIGITPFKRRQDSRLTLTCANSRMRRNQTPNPIWIEMAR